MRPKEFPKQNQLENKNSVQMVSLLKRSVWLALIVSSFQGQQKHQSGTMECHGTRPLNVCGMLIHLESDNYPLEGTNEEIENNQIPRVLPEPDIHDF